MKKWIAIAGLIFSFWIFMSLLSPTSAQALGEARLSLLQGDVAIQTKDIGDEWGAASINAPLVPGTKLWVPEGGKAEVQFIGGSYLRAAGNTDVDFIDLKMESQDSIIQVGVPQGRTYVFFAGSNAKNSVFQMDTPGISTRAYGESRFKVDIYNDGYAEVSVFGGSVYVETQNGNTKADAGSMLSVDADQNAQLSPMRAADSWDQWNQSRDSALVRGGPSRRYLPATLDTYSSDFDAYGRWVSTADYGYVWAPTVVVAGWAPYRLGRWCWIGGDYVWVSFEPWGWAPYHYGRWAFLANVGWCWVPPLAGAVYWSPGYVAWIQTPSYVSWVPLAPREIYYGYGYYGPWSVNIRNININRVNITNVYVNAKVVNAVTVVSRQTFLTGKPARVGNAPANPFVAGVRVTPGRPEIRPVRATSLPQPLKVVPQKALPSRQVLTTAAKIQHRPVALRKEVSVFRPGYQAPSMHVTRVEQPRPIGAVQKGQPQVKRKEAGPQKGPTGGPSAPSPHREFGIAPQHQGQSGTPPAQTKGLGPSGQSKPTPPVQRKEIIPLSVQKGPKGGPSEPSTHREFGIAPQQQGQPETPPTQRKELGPSGQNKATPPVQRKEIRPPSVQKGQTGGPSAPSTHREFGVAPQQPRQPATPPVQRKELSPPKQLSRPTPPAVRQESRPPLR